MYTRISAFFLSLFVILVSFRAEAQSMDYLRHNKIFNLCSFERDCSGCYDCQYQRYTVRIKNLLDKQIKQVSYVYYSESRNKVITRQATIVGSVIDPGKIGHLLMCMPNGRNWAITELVYEDDSKNSFVVKDRLSQFYQEADECDCAKKPNNLPNPNIGSKD